jgi:hypothetical protein
MKLQNPAPMPSPNHRHPSSEQLKQRLALEYAAAKKLTNRLLMMMVVLLPWILMVLIVSCSCAVWMVRVTWQVEMMLLRTMKKLMRQTVWEYLATNANEMMSEHANALREEVMVMAVTNE